MKAPMKLSAKEWLKDKFQPILNLHSITRIVVVIVGVFLVFYFRQNIIEFVVKWIEPILIIAFGSLYWQINHQLHKHQGISYDQVKKEVERRIREENLSETDSKKLLEEKLSYGERKQDKYMGLANLLFLLPIFIPFGLFRDSAVALILCCTGWPVVVTLALGRWRKRETVSTVLILGANGGILGFLSIIDNLSTLKSCTDYAITVTDKNDRLDVLTFCAESARFWMNTWITSSITFLTIFAATLIAMYTLRPRDYGWRAQPEERQILAMLYSIAAIFLMVEGFILLGLPLIKVHCRII